jgi:hypothetical protein
VVIKTYILLIGLECWTDQGDWQAKTTLQWSCLAWRFGY